MSKIFKKLYAKSSTGKIKHWEIEARGEQMIIRSGCIGDKIKELPSKKIKGKNIGRSNETSPEQQCELECQSKWNKKIDEQYVESVGAVTNYSEKGILLPMLAHKFTDRKHKIVYPCYAQPKLNGVRCTRQTGTYYSRLGKTFTTLGHLDNELNKLGIEIPDGEIYVHGMSFQQIIRLVKKDRGDGSNAKLEYWIYDQINDDIFDKRTTDLGNAFPDKSAFTPETKVKFVETVEINSEADVKKWHDKYVKNGYEGIILRNKEGKYAIKHRSVDLQKYKEFIDEEYPITGAHEGTGTEAGTAVFEVEVIDTNGEPHTLNVRPRGTREIRRQYLLDIDKYISQKLTVRYQEKSEDGVPIFPVGVIVRDYEG